MTTIVYRYRVWCTDPVAHYEFVWGTTAPTVSPSDGSPIDTSKTAIVQTVRSDDHTVANFPLSAFGELSVATITPLVQLSFSYSNHPQLTNTTITGSGTVTNSDNMCVVSTGAAINSSAKMSSNTYVKYRAGQGIIGRFSGLFTAGVVGNTQMIGLFDDDGLGFGYNGVDFGVFRKKGGVTTWVTQTNWNLDPLDGTGPSGVNIDFSQEKGNVFEIRFQFLGFGGLTYFVENPSTSDYIKVHIIKYSNANTLPNFNLPSFPLSACVENTTNNTDIIMKSASMMGGIEGVLSYSGPQFTEIWNDLDVIKNNETFVIAWNVKNTFNGHPSKIFVYATKIVLATGTKDKPQKLKLYKNATFTSPVWTDVSTSQSVVQRLTSGTWNGDGNLITQQIVPGKAELFVENIEISPTSLYGKADDNLVITLEGLGGNGSSSGSLSWLEDQ